MASPMHTFASCFLTALDAAPKRLQAQGEPIRRSFGRWRGAIRKRRLARAEHHVAVELGYSADEIAAGIDWGTVDWKAVLALVVKILLALLPLLLL